MVDSGVLKAQNVPSICRMSQTSCITARRSELLHQNAHVAHAQRTQRCKYGEAVFVYQSGLNAAASPKNAGRRDGGFMKNRIELDFWAYPNEILNRMRREGVLCTVVDEASNHNIITLGWGQIGPFYHGHPVFAIAVTPQRHSWIFLEKVPEFVIAVPDDSLRRAVDLCGTLSGRDADKFKASGLTPVESSYVKAPSVLECPINIECRVYAKVSPPHFLLTPEHRKAPVEYQHTIYFAEVLGTFGWEADCGHRDP